MAKKEGLINALKQQIEIREERLKELKTGLALIQGVIPRLEAALKADQEELAKIEKK